MQSGSITQLPWLRSRRGANYHLLIFLLELAKPSLCALFLSSLHFHLVVSFNGGLQAGGVAAASFVSKVRVRPSRDGLLGVIGKVEGK